MREHSILEVKMHNVGRKHRHLHMRTLVPAANPYQVVSGTVRVDSTILVIKGAPSMTCFLQARIMLLNAHNAYDGCELRLSPDAVPQSQERQTRNVEEPQIKRGGTETWILNEYCIHQSPLGRADFVLTRHGPMSDAVQVVARLD